MFWLSHVFTYLNVKNTYSFTGFRPFTTFSAYFDVIYHVIGDDVSDKIINYRKYTYSVMVNIYQHLFFSTFKKTGQICPKTYPALYEIIMDLCTAWYTTLANNVLFFTKINKAHYVDDAFDFWLIFMLQ